MKMLTSIFRSKKDAWGGHWHSSCKHPKTISFRLSRDGGDGIFKTVNSVYLDISEPGIINTSTDPAPSCFFADCRQSTSTSPEEESVESVISRVVRSERLFFEPERSNSILQGVLVGQHQQVPFKESVAHAMESKNPYLDFRRSMEEMVEYHELNEWGHLVHLLDWYLKANGNKNHKFIIGAFVDLVMSINNVRSDATSTYYSSAASSISSPCFFSSSEKADQRGSTKEEAGHMQFQFPNLY
uniref:Transcription repressor n=1 Tax=Kalanchoe fedtschenkoi TaxID=63787 RepID=A0A7N0T3B2_KALFE